MGHQKHFSELARLLEIERHAEAERALASRRRLRPADAEASGSSLVDLVVSEQDAGLGGRFLLRLVKRSRTPFPWTRLDVGSPVILSPQTEKLGAGTRGVISRRRPDLLEVAFADVPDDLTEFDRWRIDLSHDEIALERQQRALRMVSQVSSGRLAQLRGVLMGERPAESMTPGPLNLPESFNLPQREAIAHALAARDVALIHGPPGTGKTTVVVEVIRQAVMRGERVLVTAPSHLAVDNVFERLLRAGVNAVRLGHPARVLPELREHTLDELVDCHDDVKVARKLVKEALKLFQQAQRHTRAKPAPGAKRAIRDEAKALLADARRIESQTVAHLLDSAEVLCCTTTGLDDELLGDRRFDLGVIDEACQGTEPNTWIPILRCQRMVLAGDPCQLPPTVIASEAQQGGLAQSLFERLQKFNPAFARQLTVQYRMHRDIMSFPSREFYQNTLEAHPSVAEHRLTDLPQVAVSPLTEAPIEWIDTAGASFDEELEPDGESRCNPGEARLALHKITQLLLAGVPGEGIALITPYAAQVRLLRKLLAAVPIEIDTVDGFQGREKEAIVISFVRANATGEIGFLSDLRRTNVAITRAKRKLILIGDSATLAHEPLYRDLIEYCEQLGSYRSVWEEGLVD